MYQSTGPTGAQVEAGLLAKLNATLPPTEDIISPDMVMSERAKFWWLEFEDLKRAANTRRRYREIIDTYILPGVGNLTISLEISWRCDRVASLKPERCL